MCQVRHHSEGLRKNEPYGSRHLSYNTFIDSEINVTITMVATISL